VLPLAAGEPPLLLPPVRPLLPPRAPGWLALSVLVPELEHAQAKPRIRHDFKMRGSSLRGRSSLEPRFGAQRGADAPAARAMP